MMSDRFYFISINDRERAETKSPITGNLKTRNKLKFGKKSLESNEIDLKLDTRCNKFLSICLFPNT